MWDVVTMLPFMQITKWSYISLLCWLNVKRNRNCVWTHINITSVKEKFIIIIKLSLGKRKIDYKRENGLQSLETKPTVKKRKKKKKKDNLWLHFYYKFVLWSLGWLGGCCHGRGRTFTFEVFLGKYRESCQHNLHVVGSLFFLGGVFGDSWWQGGIMGHFLCCVCCLFSDLRLLYLLGGGGGMLAIGRFLVGLSLPSSASLEAVSALQLEELKARMARG